MAPDAANAKWRGQLASYRWIGCDLNVTFAPRHLPQVDDLVQVAHAAGRTNASRRTINYWVSRGLVSKPKRIGDRFVYPAVSVGQVDTLARWHPRLTRPALIKFALYIETNSVSNAEALRIVDRELAAWEIAAATLNTEIPDVESLKREAAVAARMRGGNTVFPRTIRLSLEERSQALLFIASQMPVLSGLGNGPLGDQVALERMMGLRSGRGGGARDVSAIFTPTDISKFDPVEAYGAIRHATASQARLARHIVELVYLWMPAAIPTMLALDRDSAPFLAVVTEATEMITPESYLALFCGFLARVVARPPTEIAEAIPALDPPAAMLEMLKHLNPDEQRLVASRLRPFQRMRFEWLLDRAFGSYRPSER